MILSELIQKVVDLRNSRQKSYGNDVQNGILSASNARAKIKLITEALHALQRLNEFENNKPKGERTDGNLFGL